jgi:hypothetical protein
MTANYLDDHIINTLTLMPDITSAELAFKLDAPVNTVKNALCRLHDRRKVMKQRYGKSWVWRTYEKPEGVYTEQSQRIDKMSGFYDGKELQRNPGIPAARFEAFNLPSLMGGQRVYPRRAA